MFPAPSHVVDGTLHMLRVETAFGDPVSRPGWPGPAKPATDAERLGRDARLAGRTLADNPFTTDKAKPAAAAVADAESWRAGYRLATASGPKFKAARVTLQALAPGAFDDGFLRMPKAIPAAAQVPPAVARGFADAWTKDALENPYVPEIARAEEARSAAESEWRRGFDTANQRWWNSPLVEGVLVSLVRLAVGFVVSLVIGVLIGALAWRFEPVDKFIGPVLLGVQTLPSVCWVPLGIILFSIGENGILFVLAMGSFSAVAIALRDGLRAIPPLYQQAGRMMGARRWKLYWYVLLPASLPAMATSLRQGFSFAWRSLMGAELILAVRYEGLGHLLSIGRDVNAVEQVVAVLIIMILIGMLADKWVFAKIQRRVSARFGLVPAGG